MKVKKIGKENNDSSQEYPMVIGRVEETVNIKFSDKVNSKHIFIIIGSAIISIVILYFLYHFFSNQDTKTIESSNVISFEKKNDDELKNKELELKERELLLKEKEIQQNKLSQNSNETKRYNLMGKYPETSERYITSNEIVSLSKYELKIMRNEIFARHGYIFKTKDMNDYFSRQNWYSPRYDNVDFLLTKIEKENIKLIKYFEN